MVEPGTSRSPDGYHFVEMNALLLLAAVDETGIKARDGKFHETVGS